MSQLTDDVPAVATASKPTAQPIAAEMMYRLFAVFICDQLSQILNESHAETQLFARGDIGDLPGPLNGCMPQSAEIHEVVSGDKGVEGFCRCLRYLFRDWFASPKMLLSRDTPGVSVQISI